MRRIDPLDSRPPTERGTRHGEAPTGTESRPLDPRRPYKPLDVGEAGLAASVDAHGRVLLLTEPHARHGMVALSAAPRLAAHRRYDTDAVRRYRRRLSARGAPAVGLRWGAAAGGQVPRPGPPSLLAHAIPVTPVAGGAGTLATLVPHPDDAGGARGFIQLLAPGSPAPDGWAGRFRLGPAEYPELTEAGPLAPVPARPDAEAGEGSLVVEDRGLGWAVAVHGHGLGRGEASVEGPWVRAWLPANGSIGLVAIGVGRDAEEARAHARSLGSLDAATILDAARLRWERRWQGWPAWPEAVDLVARRAAAYIAACCAIPVGDAVCLVADHALLPLAWTRDGYFLARTLLSWPGNEDEARTLVRRHLRWLFEVADRPDGWWARSHLVSGARKDPVYQLDQQLYPLLELTDYVEVTGDREPLEAYGPEIRRVLDAVHARRARGVLLYATDETAADDPIAMPYLTANQILAWHVLRRMSELGIGGGRLGERATTLREAVARHQIVTPSVVTPTGEQVTGGAVYAYATDLAGGHILYHDANDWPLAMAPHWGFCSADDPIWRATVAFAFSSQNPGFFPGRRGGLGSVHTPAPWPLGHLQDALVGSATGDADRWIAALSRAARAAHWDGALPEASDPRTGRPISRPWFGWPNATFLETLVRGPGAPDR